MHYPNKHTHSNWNHVSICNSLEDNRDLNFEMLLISIISKTTTLTTHVCIYQMHQPNKHTHSIWNHVPICNSFADMEVLKFQMPLISIISNCTTAVMCPTDAQPQQTYPFLHVPIRCAALTNLPIYLWWLPVSSILPLWFGGKSGKMLKYGPNLPRKRAHYTKFSESYKYAFHIWKKADLIGEKKSVTLNICAIM